MTVSTVDNYVGALDELRAWQEPLREHFPIFANNPRSCYLDSAATAQKPEAVVRAVTDYLTRSNANAGRGSYPWANETTSEIERIRKQVKEFLDDAQPDRSGVHFVGGASAGLRSVALDWLANLLDDGDEIIVPCQDHSANMVPWKEVRDVLARRGTTVVVHEMPYDDASGDYDHRALPGLVNERTRFVAATHVHHVFGGNMNVHRVRAAVGPDVPICLDAAQSIGHRPVSVSEVDVDFVVFSGHKMMSLPGIGAVWSRNLRGPAYQPGGWAGTPNTTGVISLGAAMDWLAAAGVGNIERWTTALGLRLTDALSRWNPYSVLGCQQSLTVDSDVQRREGPVTFRHREIGSNDLGFILESAGFMVRADSHCQAGREPNDGAVRVSFHVYNTEDEVDRLIATLADLT